MSLVDDNDRHNLYLQRLASGLLKTHVYPSLEDAYKAARLLLLDQGDIKNLRQLNAILRKVDASTTKITAAALDEVTKELNAIAVYEASYYAALVGGYAGSTLSVPGKKTIQDFIDSALMSLVSGERVNAGTWSEFIGNQIASTATVYNNAIKASFVNGESLSQGIKRMREATQGLLRREYETLIRTGLQHYFINAREAMANDNLDILEKRYYNAVFDNRTSLLCRGRAGKTWLLTDDTYPRLPAHFNCLSEDTLVTTCSDVSNVYKRRYKGVMVNFTTKAGRSVKITPNHPVLTGRGWVKAGELNLLDKVVTIESIASFAGKDYKNSVVSEFGKLFSSVNVLANPNFVTVRPTATEDFHGDVTDTDVEVVNTNGLRWGGVRECVNDGAKDNLFPLGALIKSSFNRFRSLLFLSNTPSSASDGIMSRFREVSYLLWGAFCHSSKLLFRAIPKGTIDWLEKIRNNTWRAFYPDVLSYPVNANSRFVSGYDSLLFFIGKFNKSGVFKGYARGCDSLVNKTNRNAEALCNFDWHNTAGAKLDDLVSVDIVNYDGHVYNLENKDNWYLSNGIITHNCRSSYLFLLKGQDAPSGTRAAIGGKDTERAEEKYENRSARTDKKIKYRGRKDSDMFNAGQIDASTGVDAWMRNQPDWFIADSLGDTRAKLFKDGKLSISQFTDATGRTLTLQELAERDAAAFARAGLPLP